MDTEDDMTGATYGLADTLIAYALVAWALLQSNSSTLMGLLGFLLLVAKLVQEVPRAWRTLFPKPKRDYDEQSN